MKTERVDHKHAWTPAEYCHAVGLGRTSIYAAIKDRRLHVVKFGRRTLIITPPQEFLASLAA